MIRAGQQSETIFTAAAIGVPAPSLQWRFNGVEIAGATNSSYTKSNIQTNDTGSYSMVASNWVGTAITQDSFLQVYDSAVPLLSSFSYNPEQFQVTVSGVTNSSYVVEASSNLIDWSMVWTGVVTFIYTNSDAINASNVFYRARYQP